MMEYNNSYYCLEDIDRVLPVQSARQPKYWIYALSAAMLMLAFLVFMYSSYGNMLYISSSLVSGNAAVLANWASNNLSAIIETALIILCLVSGVLLFMQSRNGVRLGIATSVSAVIAFSYQLAGILSIYFIVIDAAVFVSLMAMLYLYVASRHSAEANPLRKETVEDKLLKWPGSGRF